jgi:plasmid maintenance system killer protein
MIRSFRDPGTARLFAGSRVPRFANIAAGAERKLQQLDSAATLDALRSPPASCNNWTVPQRSTRCARRPATGSRR